MITVSRSGSHHHLYLSVNSSNPISGFTGQEFIRAVSPSKFTTKKLAPPFADKETGGRQEERK